MGDLSQCGHPPQGAGLGSVRLCGSQRGRQGRVHRVHKAIAQQRHTQRRDGDVVRQRARGRVHFASS